MANIPTVALTEVPTAPGLAPRLSADAFNATNRAITQVGGVIQDVGGMLNKYAMQKQEHVNKGYLAGEEAVRMQTAAQIEEFARNNPDKPETWGKMQESTWKSYELGRAERARAQGWGNDVVSTDKQLASSYKAEFGIRFNAEIDKGLIRQGNARLESVATMHINSGNVKGALAAVDQMTIYPDQRQAKIEQITNAHVYGQYDREMSDISTLPPAERVKALAVVESELTTVDKKEVPVNGYVTNEQGERVGGLSQPARTDLVRAARARVKGAEQEIEAEVRRLLSVHSLGSAAFNEQAEASYKAGLIQAQIVAKPDGLGFSMSDTENAAATVNTLRELGPVALKIEQDKQARIAYRANEEQKKMTDAAKAQLIKGQDMSKKAMSGDLTEEEVVTAVTNGEINEQNGKALTGTIRARAQLSVFRQGMKSTDLDDKKYIKNISDYANMSNEDKDDVTHEERMAMLGFMDKDPVLSASGKAEAMKQYLDALGVDLQGWEDNGKTKRPHINGRDIGEIEARARARVYASFKSAPNLGSGWAGTAMIQAEQEITDFFTSDDYKPDAANKDASDKLVERINQRVYNLAAASWIGRLYP